MNEYYTGGSKPPFPSMDGYLSKVSAPEYSDPKYASKKDEEKVFHATTAAMEELEKGFNVGIEEVGASTNPFEHQTQALKARIFHGANRVEFTFFAQGKSQRQSYSPEVFGSRERQDMRELAEFNNVQTTTHASVGVNSLSGLNMQQGVFDDQQRQMAIDEIKRAIHFAADATTGGAVVFHTGEAPRRLYGKWDSGHEEFKRHEDDGTPKAGTIKRDAKGNPEKQKMTMFQMYPDEDVRGVQYLVDPKTKAIIEQVRGTDRIAVPIFELEPDSKKIGFLKDEKGEYVREGLLAGDPKDPNKPIYDRIFQGRMPKVQTDRDTGDIQTKLIEFKDFKNWLRDEVYSRDPEILKEPPAKREDIIKERLEEKNVLKDFAFMKKFLDIQYNLYFGLGSEREYTALKEDREKLINQIKYFENLKETNREAYDREKRTKMGSRMAEVPGEQIEPIKYYKDQLYDVDRRLQQSKEMAINGRRQARQVLDMVYDSELAEDFARRETKKSMAELGIYAWQKTQEAHKKFEEGKSNYDLKNPIYLAPENLFPEFYGAHPQELMTLVQEGREEMQKHLADQWGMSDKKAKATAEQHIRATFDIGHANVWWKYFKSIPNESLDHKKRRFNEWLLDQTKELIDKKIISHIHISDNMGFHDEHLAAGDGNAPIKEFVALAKKSGLNDMIVETGSLNPMTALPDTWAHFDSPVYNLHVPGFTNDHWTNPSAGWKGSRSYGYGNFHQSYFGRTAGPTFLFGDLSPSDDFKGAPFYSGMPLE